MSSSKFEEQGPCLHCFKNRDPVSSLLVTHPVMVSQGKTMWVLFMAMNGDWVFVKGTGFKLPE